MITLSFINGLPKYIWGLILKNRYIYKYIKIHGKLIIINKECIYLYK